MKAITIRIPWAYLICSGIKDVENRSWRTSFRGRVLVHTAASDDLRGIAPHIVCPAPRSAIIGSIEIVDCVQDSPSPWAFDGFWHWVLRNPVLFDTPILHIRGALSFWEVPEGVGIPVDA